METLSYFLLTHGPQPMLTTLIIPLLSTRLLILLYLHRNKQSGSEKKRPPGPLALPIIDNHHQLGSLPHCSLAHLTKIYGPLMHLKLGQVPTLVVSSPKMAELLMKTYDHAFCSRPILVATNYLTYNGTYVAFAPYGSYWRHVRKICILELLSSKRVQSFGIVRKEEVRRLVDSIFLSSKAKALVNLRDVFLSLTNNVLCRVAFGKSYWEEEPELREIMKTSQKLTGLQRRLEKHLSQRDSFLEKVFAEHLLATHGKEEEEKDLVDVLLQLQKEGTPDFTLSTDNIKSVVMDMFVAGTATTATALVWGMSELMKNQLALKKAQDELHYLKAVVKEILRLHPPGPLLVPRELIEDCNIEGYHIPVKTRVLVNAWAIGRHPYSWIDPEDFRPERAKGMPALAIVELALANVLLCFNWAMPDGKYPEDLDTNEASGLAVHKETSLPLVATPQTTSQ
ncbi:hypothetical protein AMTR_s00181p00047760 [Amborella trichopoda]|uniref:Cytochrome P450 n=1 Tax=Amborella trichopoda TaxID=13333 RepID=W1P544_AMBTC|nr:hypothetical protein AMTR_s00181p00047760 [Amborella trichopoda]